MSAMESMTGNHDIHGIRDRIPEFAYILTTLRACGTPLAVLFGTLVRCILMPSVASLHPLFRFFPCVLVAIHL